MRLAFGSSSRLCPIHRKFRIVVVVEKVDAYTRLAPPLLNRFEKQVMERQHLLKEQQLQLVARLKDFAALFTERTAPSAQAVSAVKDQDGKAVKSPVSVSKSVMAPADAQSLAKKTALKSQQRSNLKGLRAAFCGYHSDVVSSLAQSMPEDGFADFESRFQEAARRLLYIATPEALCRMLGNKRQTLLLEEHRVDVLEVYFKQQLHRCVLGIALVKHSCSVPSLAAISRRS